MVPHPPGKATIASARADITALRSCSDPTMRISVRPVCAISLVVSARGRTPITSAPPASAASAQAPISPQEAPPYTSPSPRRAISAPSSSAPIRYDSRAPAFDPAKTQIRFISLPHHALEDRVDVPELAVQIEAFGQFLRLEQLLYLGILGEQRAEVAVLSPPLHRVPLDHDVGALPLHPLLDQLQEHRLREDQPPCQLEVLAHPLRIDAQPLDQAREAVQHEVESDRGVGPDDALDAGVADVPLVPEGHVLQRRQRVAAQHAREPAQVLGEDRVPLVRHRRGALLPLAE